MQEICYLTKLASTTVRASTALSIRPCDLYQATWRTTPVAVKKIFPQYRLRPEELHTFEHELSMYR